MAERGPTVIERMIAAFWNATGWPDFFGDPGNKILDHKKQEHRKAMLAAVRELYRCQIERGEKYHCMSAACMLEVIEDHERRAGGKGE